MPATTGVLEKSHAKITYQFSVCRFETMQGNGYDVKGLIGPGNRLMLNISKNSLASLKISFMKYTILLLLVAFTMGCDKDDSPETLPEATQTGRGIFACYVDGKPFIDQSGSPDGISFNSYYQNVGGEYYFNVSGSTDNNEIGSFATMKVATNRRDITQGGIYALFSNDPGNAWGGGSVNISTTDSEFSGTNGNFTGELIITKFDLQNQIVSGIFWMNLQHPLTGDTVKVTEGRFDTHFGL